MGEEVFSILFWGDFQLLNSSKCGSRKKHCKGHRVETYLTGYMNLKDHLPGIPGESAEKGNRRKMHPLFCLIRSRLRTVSGRGTIFQQRELLDTHSDMIEASFR